MKRKEKWSRWTTTEQHRFKETNRETQYKQNYISEARNMIAVMENTSEKQKADKDQPTQQPQQENSIPAGRGGD